MVRRELLAFHLRVEQERDEVVARVLHVVGDVAVEVRVELHELGHAVLGALVADVAEDEVHPSAELVGVLQREPQHLGDDEHRDVLAVLERGVDIGAVTHLVDEVVAQLLHL